MNSQHFLQRRGQYQRVGVWRALVLVWVVVAWAAMPSLAQRLIWLGTLPGGDVSNAFGVSADGSVVVGIARNAAGQQRAFRWTAARGMQDLGTLPGCDVSEARGVSADGSVVVGKAEGPFQMRAFRWTAAGGMQDLLGTLGGNWSEATGVSANGLVVVGKAYNAADYARAFRCTAAGWIQDLGTLGGKQSAAYGVSADGSVVVGTAWNAASKWRAFRWTAARGMQDLGTLPGGDGSEAYGVSADGPVVVGTAWNFRDEYRPFRWTAAGGMEDLNFTYANLLTDGSVLVVARAISPDGRYIVGGGYNAATGRGEAYLLDVVGYSNVDEQSGTPGLELHLLPQPAHENVVIKLSRADGVRGITLAVYDALGRAVAEPLCNAVLSPGVQQGELDVHTWAAGQ